MESGAGGDGFSAARAPPPQLLIDGIDIEDDLIVNGMEDLSTAGISRHTPSLPLHGVAEGSSLMNENFEKVIGAIEEIVVAEEFQSLQNFFLSTYWTQFKTEEGEEAPGTTSTSTNLGGEGNKETEERHEHFKIFTTYSQEMAHLLENQLKRIFRDDSFNFNQFVEDLGRRAECNGDEARSLFETEIFEMLFTLTDFVKFKELFTDYRMMMEGKTPNLSTGITLKGLPSSPRN